MKTSIYVSIFLALLVSSCDFMLKKEPIKKPEATFYVDPDVSYTPEDSTQLCDLESGYRYSLIKQECIRIFAEGFRLNPIELEEGDAQENELEDNDVSCFVVFSPNKTSAELFLPNQGSGVIVTQTQVKGLYQGLGWELDTRKAMRLSLDGQLYFTAAKTIELKLIGTDQGFEAVMD